MKVRCYFVEAVLEYQSTEIEVRRRNKENYVVGEAQVLAVVIDVFWKLVSVNIIGNRAAAAALRNTFEGFKGDLNFAANIEID